ncbi:MAG: glycerophosphodiester phosphodiesterase family protein [Candidatus Woesearchaeota archaeon]
MVKKNPLIIAHRGASGSAPENTRAAFLEAIKENADVIELDVHMTKDKKVVVNHDASINRTSNGTGFIHLKTLKYLKRFNFGHDKEKEEIPTLEEALECIGNSCKIIVELKLLCYRHERLILNIIDKFKYKENVWIHTSHRKIIKKVRKLDPNIRIGHIMLFTFVQQFLLPLDAAFGKKYNVSFYSIEDMFIEKYFIGKFIQKIKDKNKEVYPWVINDLNSAKLAIKWGVDGIITNYPGIMKEKLL